MSTSDDDVYTDEEEAFTRASELFDSMYFSAYPWPVVPRLISSTKKPQPTQWSFEDAVKEMYQIIVDDPGADADSEDEEDKPCAGRCPTPYYNRSAYGNSEDEEDYTPPPTPPRSTTQWDHESSDDEY
uniref:Uncharacterized protein n=1 Tax=Panagrolaimus superbus TaxID=310955 RepID=A0A914YWX5_9BILA